MTRAAAPWAILTVEYPPEVGGVSGYTQALATALADCGREVHVWVPAQAGAGADDPRVHVHLLPGRFGPRALRELSRALDAMPRQYRLLVQYVPQGFGWRAMNVAFCAWLWRRRSDRPWVIFHEVAMPREGWRPDRRLQAHVTEVMARVVCAAADRVFVSIPGWADALRRLRGRPVAARWLPIPSTVPTSADPDAVRRVRTRLTGSTERPLIGHFGVSTHGGAATLRETLTRLLAASPDRHAVLVGRHSEEVAAAIVRSCAAAEGRVHATGLLGPHEVAAHLTACDVLVQPYPDGVSSRRTSAMAGVGLGLPVVTSDGHLTEQLWRETGALLLAKDNSPDSLVDGVERMLADPEHRRQFGANAAALYRDSFSIEHTVAALLSAADDSGRCPAGFPRQRRAAHGVHAA